MESECIDGEKAIVTIIAGGPAVGAGATATGTTGKIEFEDYNAGIDPQVFSGPAKYAAVGYAFIGLGYGASINYLGGAKMIGHGYQMGWDASIYLGSGISTVTDVKHEDCSCE